MAAAIKPSASKIIGKLLSALVLSSMTVLAAACGTMTGLPGHGGGKRFAIEQELVAAATRAAIKQIDLSALQGKKVNLFVNAIGDTGTGNLVGGRYSIVSQLRGDYVQGPTTTATNVFPRVRTTTSSDSTTRSSSSTSSTTVNGSGSATTTSGGSESTTVSRPTTTTESSRGSSVSSTSGVSETTSVLNYPEETRTIQKGAGGVAQAGVEFKGLGAYHNSEEISSTDLQYLTALIQTFFFLRGVNVVPPSEAEIDVYVTVDVFGTVRTRVDWLLANNEILQAKTFIEVLAIDHLEGTLVMPPQSAGSETEYNEQFVLWVGPISIRKSLKKSEPLLSDFTDLRQAKAELQPVELESPIPYPFRREMEKWREKN